MGPAYPGFLFFFRIQDILDFSKIQLGACHSTPGPMEWPQQHTIHWNVFFIFIYCWFLTMASLFADIELLNDAYCQACEWDVSSFPVTVAKSLTDNEQQLLI
jgi:hypothetical protein